MRIANIETKATPSADGTVSFVASTATEDRMGDTIDQNGWDLRAYRKNPIILFGHNHDQPVGRAKRVEVRNGSLEIDIEYMPEEVSPFAAMIGRMANAGFLPAVSVGFRPLEYEPRKKGGLHFKRQELLEVSSVTVPANGEALAFAKSFASPDDIRRLFAAQSEVRSRVAKARIKGLLASYGEIAVSTLK